MLTAFCLAAISWLQRSTLRLEIIGIFALFPFGAFCQEPHHTTAYIGTPGSADFLPSYSTYSTDHFWNKSGKSLPTYNHFQRRSFLLYAEYALTSCNSITFNGGYSRVEESLNGASQSLNDMVLGWKQLLQKTGRYALTVQIAGLIPAGDKKSSIRYGVLGAQATLLCSSVFAVGGRNAWCDLGLGYRYYHGFPSDQICANAALGQQVRSGLNVIASAQLEYGILNGKSRYNMNNVAFHPNYRLLNVQVECVIRAFSKVAISFGAYKHVWGQNVGIGGGYFCGIWINF
jgi:hypothetical protein